MKKRFIVQNFFALFFFTVLVIGAHRWFKLAAIVPVVLMNRPKEKLK